MPTLQLLRAVPDTAHQSWFSFAIYNQANSYNSSVGSNSSGPSGHTGGSSDRCERFNRGDRHFRPQKTTADHHNQSVSLEHELRNLLSKVRELEGKVQKDNREWRRRSLGRQANTVESDPTNVEAYEQEPCGDEHCEEDFASQVVDAYLAEVNLIDSKTPHKAWYLDSSASNHVTGDPSIFSSMSPSSGTKIISARGQTCKVMMLHALVMWQFAFHKKEYKKSLMCFTLLISPKI